MTCKIILFTVATLLATSAYTHHPGPADFDDREIHNLGRTVNTQHFEGFPMIMADGLTLHFSSDRPGGQGDLDVYVAQRTSVDDEWETSVNTRYDKFTDK